MIGLTRFLFILLQCLLLPHLHQSSRSKTLPTLPECNESEYLCSKESRCIPKTKVCNFIHDCLDGSDEWECGTCNFEDEPERCGLKFRADRVYSWFRRDVTEEFPISGTSDEPIHYMTLGLNIQKHRYISASGSNWHLLYKPMVTFPELRSTDNENCRFSLRILVTDHVSPLIVKSKNRISWPQMNVIITAPKKLNSSIGTNHRSIDLELSNTLAGHHGSWYTFTVPIGAQDTVWTLEMLVSVHLESYLLHLSDFLFLDCHPSDEWLSNEDEGFKQGLLTEAPLYWHEACNSHQFKCELTGKCIDQSLVCDFGYDCGTDDPSDESNCDQYPARCNFEDGDICDWIPVSGTDAWKLISAEEEDQKMYKMHRPSVDHTFRSNQAGHYLLLDTRLLRVSEKYSLAGPRITLREQAKECSFRFWYQVAPTLSFDVVKSPYLSVGFEHISAGKLFEHLEVTGESWNETLPGAFEVRNMGWRRMQVQLLDRYNVDERVLSALEISFGNFDVDLQYYIDRGGYLALDDFSFSEGCSVAFYGPRREQYCTEGQFLCLTKTPVTGAHCIPIENYCDFKNDCGLLSSQDELASDEVDCPQECFFRKEQHCGFKLMDAKAKRISNELTEEVTVNEAFTWSMGTESSKENITSPGSLSISSNSDNFIKNYMKSLEDGNKKLVELDTFEVRLPVFSVSHSNCTFSMEYEWAHGGNNIKADLRLVDLTKGHRNLLKTIWNKRDRYREGIEVGLGNQKSQFNIEIAVSHRHEVEDLKVVKESFIVHHYKFTSCSFFPGLIPPGNEVKFINEDGNDDEMYSGMDYLGDTSQSDLDLLNKECPPGYFQCDVPIVCIPNELVCDMQQDCQGGADEFDCSQYHQYDLYQHIKDDSLPADWLVGGGEKLRQAPNKWRRINGMATARRVEDSGPPFDHTSSDHMGDYFLAGGEAKPQGKQVTSDLHSPLFQLVDGSESLEKEAKWKRCRVVFYQYSWGKGVGSLRVLKRTFPSGKAYIIHESIGPIADKWLRNWIELDPRMRADSGDKEFSLVFQYLGGGGVADAIALDDISFSPACIRGISDETVRLSTKLVIVDPPSSGVNEMESSGESRAQIEATGNSKKLGGPLRVGVLFLLATCGLGLLGYVALLGYRKATSMTNGRQSLSQGNQMFLAAQYSLNNLDKVHLVVPSETQH